MKAYALLLVAALHGCALTPSKIVEVPVEVKVPVPVRCKVKKPVPPASITDAEIPPGFFDRGVALIKEGNDFRLYSKELEAALSACADFE